MLPESDEQQAKGRTLLEQQQAQDERRQQPRSPRAAKAAARSHHALTHPFGKPGVPNGTFPVLRACKSAPFPDILIPRCVRVLRSSPLQSFCTYGHHAMSCTSTAAPLSILHYLLHHTRAVHTCLCPLPAGLHLSVLRFLLEMAQTLSPQHTQS